MAWQTIIGVTGVTACLPIVVRWAARKRPEIGIQPQYAWMPLAAAVLFFIAWFIPVVPVSPDTDTFQQHFVGGGLFCAVLFVYAKKLFGRRIGLLPSVLLLFAWVSAFGVANELFEFTITTLGIANVNLGDTGWDLLANTLGAVTGYLILWVCKVERTGRAPAPTLVTAHRTPV